MFSSRGEEDGRQKRPENVRPIRDDRRGQGRRGGGTGGGGGGGRPNAVLTHRSGIDSDPVAAPSLRYSENGDQVTCIPRPPNHPSTRPRKTQFRSSDMNQPDIQAKCQKRRQERLRLLCDNQHKDGKSSDIRLKQARSLESEAQETLRRPPRRHTLGT